MEHPPPTTAQKQEECEDDGSRSELVSHAPPHEVQADTSTDTNMEASNPSLWDDAYHKLKTSHNEMIQEYEKLLLGNLSTG
jgi:hypothetical protein